MNRRKALLTLGLTACGAMARSLTLPRLFAARLSGTVLDAPATSTDQEIEDRLRRDFALRSERINSEEGIAMFLALEDLAPANATAAVALTPLNAALATALERNAAAWQRIHPHAKYKDVASVIEVLAYRDFSHGGKLED
jgi:predicted DNA-binding transcriptional regulator YafY